MSKAASKYLRQIRTWLPCSRKTKKRVLTDVENIVSSYLAENPNCTYSQLQDKFGTPRQIAAAQVDEMETPELLRQLRIRRRIVTIILIAAVLFLTIWFGVALIALIDSLQDNHGYFTVTVFSRFIGGYK